VVEGAVDALSLRAQLSPEAGIVVVAAPGVSGWRPAWAELLRGRDVAVAYDRDTAGDRASAAIGKLLAGVARTVRRWTPAAPAKDWNDALTLTPTERTA
jgi:DNA primase